MRTIKLKPNGVGRYDDVSPFLITDRSLEITIQLPAVNGEFYFVAENNGLKINKYIHTDGKVKLEGLTAGELRAEVKHYLKGELVLTYIVEPLLLKEANGNLSAETDIVALRREIQGLKEEIENFKSDQIILHRQMNELLEKLAKKVIALTAFALTCINEIPYINDYKFTEDLKNED